MRILKRSRNTIMGASNGLLILLKRVLLGSWNFVRFMDLWNSMGETPILILAAHFTPRLLPLKVQS